MKYLGTITNNKDLVTKEYVDAADSTKQPTLVSGTNIKTINNQSVLGSGNISVSGGGLTIDDIYPVGSIYMTVNNVNPSTLFSGTTWQQIQDTFLLAAGSTYSAGATGGAATHTLTEAQLPSISGKIRVRPVINNSGSTLQVAYDASGHFSTASGGTPTTVKTSTATSANANDVTFKFGSGSAHNNMPPYLAVYVWKRTA